LAIFGPENYAYRLGLIGAPSRIALDCCWSAWGAAWWWFRQAPVIALLLLHAPSPSKDVAAVAE
jgi:hypothetical protein